MRVFIALIVSAAALLASNPSESDISEFTLSNGMRWVVCPTSHKGEAALLLYIDAGGAQETAGRTGLVSALSAMWRLDLPDLERAGARRPQVLSNHDRIIFRSTWGPENIESWFRTHSALVRSPSLDRFSEGQASAVAMRDKMRQGGGSLLDEFVGAAFTVHPYRHPPFGFAGEIDRIQSADAAGFLSRYFVPSNAIAVAAGDVQKEEIRALAEKYFAPLPKMPAPEPLRSVEPPQAVERRLISQEPAQQALLIAFHGPAIHESGAAVHDVLRSLVSRRLKTRLLEKEKVVSRVDTMPYPAMKYPFLTMVMCFIAPGANPATVEEMVHEELSRLAAGPIRADELEPVIRSRPEDFAKYKPFELATELADWHAMSGSWRTMFRYPEVKSKVSAADVQSLAARLFVPKERTTAITIARPPE